MSVPYSHRPSAEPPRVPASLRSNWLWMVFLGGALIVLGFIALGSPWIAGLATAMAIGTLLVVTGVIETVGTLWRRGWSGYLVHLLTGLLSIAIGLLFLGRPVEAETTVALLLACFLLLIGTFRIAEALNNRFAAWRWSILCGLIDLIFGALIFLRWPASGLWVLGVFAGINVVLRGLNWIALGCVLHTIPPQKGQMP